jgi:hypothetical protein
MDDVKPTLFSPRDVMPSIDNNNNANKYSPKNEDWRTNKIFAFLPFGLLFVALLYQQDGPDEVHPSTADATEPLARSGGEQVVAMVAVEGGSSSSNPQPQPQGERPRQTLAEWICM